MLLSPQTLIVPVQSMRFQMLSASNQLLNLKFKAMKKMDVAVAVAVDLRYIIKK